MCLAMSFFYKELTPLMCSIRQMTVKHAVSPHQQAANRYLHQAIVVIQGYLRD